MDLHSNFRLVFVRRLPYGPQGLLDDLDTQSLIDFFAYLTSKDETR